MRRFTGVMAGVLLGGILGSVGLAASGPRVAAIRFTDEAQRRGVLDLAVNSTGPTFGDYDDDGDLDLFVPVEDLAPGLADRLFENDGTGVFRDVAAERGVQNPGSLNRGAVFCDFDNDGDLDLLAATLPPGQAREKHVPTTLFRNQLKETGEPRFENVTRAARLMRSGNANDEKIGGVGDTAGGVGCADYDRDGDLDLYWKNADGDIENALFRNEGNWTFTEVTVESGTAVQSKLRESNAQGSPNWTDVDQDGWIDLLVTNERDSKILLRNKGDGTFEDITRSRRPPSGIPFLNPGYAQGACIADFDNDGDMDIYLPLADQANRLLMSRLKEKGALTYEDVTMKSGAGDMRGARGCAVADFDNDGHVDIYVNNGGPSNTLINDVIADFPPFVQFYIAWEQAENTLLRNNGDGTFSDVTRGSGAEGLGIGSGVGAADINADGFPDLFVANRTYYAGGKRVSPQPGQNRLYVNRGNRNNWVKVRLRGTRSNRNAYGAMLKVTSGDLVQYHETQSSHGYNSTSDPVITFGLGARAAVDAIEVRWPSGATQTVRAPQARSVVDIVEPEGPGVAPLSAWRWVLSLVVGFVFTSGLNWIVAEKFLNPLIKPGLDGLMRTGGDTQVGVLSAGFALIVAVVAVLTAIVRAPVHWLWRGIVVGALVSGAAFFGAYTFLSGWMYLPTGEMCRTAIADGLTVTVGAMVISFIQNFRRDRAPATGDPTPRSS